MDYIDKLAWIRIENGRMLNTRSFGKDIYYLPGGHREQGETDAEALVREIREELSVDLIPSSIRPMGVFETQAHGKPEGTLVRAACYYADYNGVLTPSSEIEEIAWLSYADREKASLLVQMVIDSLHEAGVLG